MKEMTLFKVLPKYGMYQYVAANSIGAVAISYPNAQTIEVVQTVYILMQTNPETLNLEPET